jgi:hypothetical protein
MEEEEDKFLPLLRPFFHGLLSSHNWERRRAILKRWHSPFPVNRKIHTRAADIFVQFLTDILYTPVQVKLHHNQLCIYGDAQPIEHAWLTEAEKDFVVNVLFARRQELFGSNKMAPTNNGHFLLSDFKYNATAAENVIWRREIARDFAWMVASKRDEYLLVELIVALQQLMLEHVRGKRDVFLATLNGALQGHYKLSEVPCWNLSECDERHQNEVL